MEPEYAVLGRVARRIWAVAMRDKYGANERSQKLKIPFADIGTLAPPQEIAFNDIRTTLQALISTYDNTNSLHTNAYDEAITTPTESRCAAMAIQLVINKEWDWKERESETKARSSSRKLTDLVEEAVLKEFEAIAERGGVLGAMETGYQRGKIQEESMVYRAHRKHDGSYPIVGVNTFRNPRGELVLRKLELIRSTEEEKQSQLRRLAEFHERNKAESGPMLKRLQRA